MLWQAPFPTSEVIHGVIRVPPLAKAPRNSSFSTMRRVDHEGQRIESRTGNARKLQLQGRTVAPPFIMPSIELRTLLPEERPPAQDCDLWWHRLPRPSVRLTSIRRTLDGRINRTLAADSAIVGQVLHKERMACAATSCPDHSTVFKKAVAVQLSLTANSRPPPAVSKTPDFRPRKLSENW